MPRLRLSARVGMAEVSVFSEYGQLALFPAPFFIRLVVPAARSPKRLVGRLLGVLF